MCRARGNIWAMNPTRHLTAITSVILLTSAGCAHRVKPYTTKQEQAKVETQQVELSGMQLAFADGKESGERDRMAGDPDNYRRHSPLYRPATEKAFADGYREGFRPPLATNGAVRGEGYSLGFDAGTRDRARSKPADPDAHAGEYKAELRPEFERGYLDAYGR